MMNVCVVGYYGMGNFGDELFLETLKQVFSGHNVFSWQESLDPSDIDVVIVGGGDIIAPYHFNELYFPPALKNHPTWIYGVGIVRHYPEETWPQDEVNKNKEQTQRARRFVVRDEKSAEVARKHGFHNNVEYLPDIAFSYKPVSSYPINKSRYSKLLGVCVYSYASYPLDIMAELLSPYAENGYQVIFIPMVNQNNAFSDISTCKLLREKVEDRIGKGRTLMLSPKFDIELIYSWIQSLDYFISSKLHPSLVALKSGVPVLCLSDQGKVYALLERYGMGDYAIDISSSKEILQEKMEDFFLHGKEKVCESKVFIQETIITSNEALEQLRKEIEDYFHSK